MRVCGGQWILHLPFCTETGAVCARMVHKHHPGVSPTHRPILLGVLEDRTVVKNTLNALRILIW